MSSYAFDPETAEFASLGHKYSGEIERGAPGCEPRSCAGARSNLHVIREHYNRRICSWFHARGSDDHEKALPAHIHVGDTYADLGATITAPEQDKNLGIKASVDGGAQIDLSAITIDTSIAGTHTVSYSATDTAGNTGTATRSVNVVDPAAASSTPPTIEASSTPTVSNAPSIIPNGGSDPATSTTVDAPPPADTNTTTVASSTAQ